MAYLHCYKATTEKKYIITGYKKIKDRQIGIWPPNVCARTIGDRKIEYSNFQKYRGMTNIALDYSELQNALRAGVKPEEILVLFDCCDVRRTIDVESGGKIVKMLVMDYIMSFLYDENGNKRSDYTGIYLDEPQNHSCCSSNDFIENEFIKYFKKHGQKIFAGNFYNFWQFNDITMPPWNYGDDEFDVREKAYDGFIYSGYAGYGIGSKGQGDQTPEWEKLETEHPNNINSAWINISCEPGKLFGYCDKDFFDDLLKKAKELGWNQIWLYADAENICTELMDQLSAAVKIRPPGSPIPLDVDWNAARKDLVFLDIVKGTKLELVPGILEPELKEIYDSGKFIDLLRSCCNEGRCDANVLCDCGLARDVMCKIFYRRLQMFLDAAVRNHWLEMDGYYDYVQHWFKCSSPRCKDCEEGVADWIEYNGPIIPIPDTNEQTNNADKIIQVSDTNELVSINYYSKSSEMKLLDKSPISLNNNKTMSTRTEYNILSKTNGKADIQKNVDHGMNVFNKKPLFDI